jgi:hypothetical protein
MRIVFTIPAQAAETGHPFKQGHPPPTRTVFFSPTTIIF